MTFIVVALAAEVKPLITFFKLNALHDTPFGLFASQEYALVISGMGKENALIATTYLLTRFEAKPTDLLLNIGIAAAPSIHPIGSLLLLNKLYDTHAKRYYFPEISFRHTFREFGCTTVDSPTKKSFESAVDMEAAAIFSAAIKFLPTHRLLFIKIVSDHFEPNIPSKEELAHWFSTHLKAIDELLSSLVQTPKPLIEPKLASTLTLLGEQLRLTHSQRHQLLEQVKFALLEDRKLPDFTPWLQTDLTLLPRKGRFEALLATLAR